MGNLSVKAAGGLFLSVLLILLVGNGVLGFELKVMIIVCIALLTLCCKCQGIAFAEIMDGYSERVKEMAPAFLIILGIGYLIASFMIAGTSPVLVSILTECIHPRYILVLSFMFVTVLSSLIGTSFASLGTLGIIMFNAAVIQSVPPVMAASTVISGAVFGGFISPFNDNMNATPGLYGMDVYEVIRKNRIPFVVSVIITLVLYLLMGLKYVGGDQEETMKTLVSFQKTVRYYFDTNILCILPLIVAIAFAIRKVNIIINLFISGSLGVLFGIFQQGFSLKKCLYALYWGFQSAEFFPGEDVDELLRFLVDRGGIFSMLEVFSFVLLMLLMAELLNQTGVFRALQKTRFGEVKNPFLLTVVTFLSCELLTLVTLDGIPTGVVSKDMLSNIYIKAGYDPKKIARVSIVTCNWLGNWIPWSFCANYFAGVCGVSVWAVMPYTLCLALPTIVMLIQSALGIGNERLRM
ncbi:MAG: Na+/H+ antiporter NhaC family protein [Muricomes sp.]|uniref:Na+/H+ antiporter NhaC family protein n=1 Tax=Faecalicatena contorta TaxID=39482 RepID=UPI002EC0160E|nr:Na+/H+ antiporter NhaC family protein [Muricomes sp.]